MKHLSLILGALLISVSSMAQMYIWQGGRSTASNIDSITFSASAQTDNVFIVNPSVGELQAGYTAQLGLLRNTLSYGDYQWASSNEGVATIDTQGRVTAIAPGMTILSATSGTRSQTCIFTVFDITDLYIYTPNAIAVGATWPMQIDWYPNYCQYPQNLTWTSSDPQVATIDNDGTVTALSVGTSTITVSYQNLMVSCEITVVTIEGLSITPTTVTIAPNEQTTLSANVTPYYLGDVICKWESDNTAVATVSPDGTVTGIAEGITTITASAGNFSATCKVIVSNDAALENFAIADYGLFGDVEYIDGSERYVQLTNGNSVLCKLGYITFVCWSDGLVFTNGSGFSGNGIMFGADMPIYWVSEGEDAGKYIGSAGGFRVDTLNGQIKPYTAEAGELLNVQKYGDYFKALIAYRKDTTKGLDNNLYYDSQIGTQLYSYNADKGTSTYNYGNVKKAVFQKDQEKGLQYSIAIEWYDFVNENRFLGLKANFDEQGNLESIVEPYDMRTINKEYTNIAGDSQSAPRKVQLQSESKEQYVIGDQSRLHLGINPSLTNVKRVIKK